MSGYVARPRCSASYDVLGLALKAMRPGVRLPGLHEQIDGEKSVVKLTLRHGV